MPILAPIPQQSLCGYGHCVIVGQFSIKSTDCLWPDGNWPIPVGRVCVVLVGTGLNNEMIFGISEFFDDFSYNFKTNIFNLAANIMIIIICTKSYPRHHRSKNRFVKCLVYLFIQVSQIN